MPKDFKDMTPKEQNTRNKRVVADFNRMPYQDRKSFLKIFGKPCRSCRGTGKHLYMEVCQVCDGMGYK